VGAWRQPDTLALNRYWMDRFKHDPLPVRRGAHARPGLTFRRSTTAEAAALVDAATYLPDDILVKVDRASMANSLETRAPLLDHRIVEFALALPLHYKLQGRTGKRVLRDVLYRHVPRALVDRPKMGFSIPLRQWLREDLREWALSLLEEVPSGSHLVERETVMSLWNDHQQGRQERTEQLWAVLSLLAWCKQYGVKL
jgi:asparagine synthase (glutamine-hydrolysing)